MTLRKRRKHPEVSLEARLESEDALGMQYADLAPKPRAPLLTE